MRRYAEHPNCVSRNELHHAQQTLRRVPGRHAVVGALRGAAHAVGRGQGARARAARPDGHRDGVAGQGARGHPRARPSGWPGTATPPCRTWPPGWSAAAPSWPRSASGCRRRACAPVFVPGGDQDPPAGDYTCALDLLEDLTALGRPFPQVGITGYPESHPTISDDLTVQSMWDKRRHATHVVSNLNFDPDSIRTWVDRMRTRGHHDAACCSASRARSTAPSCSRWRPRSASGTRPGSWSSTRARSPGSRRPVGSPARGSSSAARRRWPGPSSLVTGLHVYTFNQIAETEAWRRELPRPADGLDRLSGCPGRSRARGRRGCRAPSPGPGR